jgi:hypothetical protein
MFVMVEDELVRVVMEVVRVGCGGGRWWREFVVVEEVVVGKVSYGGRGKNYTVREKREKKKLIFL